MKKHVTLLAFLAFLVFVYHAWFLSLAVRTHGDWTFFFVEAMASLRSQYFTLWLSDYSFGRVLIDVGQAPTYALYGFFAQYFDAPYAISERIVHLWPAVLIPPISAYFLTLEILKDKRAALVGAVVYSSNTYILMLQTGHLTLAVAYAVTPLVLLFFIRLLDTYKFIYIVLTALFLAICAAYEPRAAYIVVTILFLYALTRLVIMLWKKQPKSQVLRMAIAASLPIVLYAVLNLYWIVGLASVQNALGESVLSRGLFGSAFFGILSSFTLFHPYWNFSKPIAFIVNTAPIYFWAIPGLAFAGLYVQRHNSKILFFGLLALLGVLLTKQVDEPFTGLYGWLFGNVPGFSAFREASKFYFIIALAYSVLIAAFAQYLIKRLNKTKINSKLIASIVVGGVSLLFMPNFYPIITSEIGTTFVKKTIPNDYLVFRDFVLEQPDFFRIYWTPRESRWSVQTSQHPRVESTTINESAWKSFTDPELNQSRASSLLYPLKQEYSNSLLDKSAIKYVVVPIRDNLNDDDFFVHYGHDRQTYIDQLDQLDYLEKINIGTKDLVIYENKGYEPYITAINKVSVIPRIDELKDAYIFQKDVLRDDQLNFTDNLNEAVPQQNILDIYGNITRRNISSKGLVNELDSRKNVASFLYTDKASSELTYTLNAKKMSFFSSLTDELKNSGTTIIQPQYSKRLISETTLNGDLEYVIKAGNTILPQNVSNNRTGSIGATPDPVDLWSVGKDNLIDNGSFENGLWEQSPRNCNAFDDNAMITMSQSSNEYTDGKHSLALSALNHTACTGPPLMRVEPGSDYLLTLDYKVINGKEANYEIKFNDASKTIIKKDLINIGQKWTTVRQSVAVPSSATSAQLLVKAQPDDKNQTKPIVYYDNLRFSKMQLELAVKPSSRPSYANKDITNIEKKYQFTQAGYNYKNILPNPSLEEGFWQDKVGDCNTHDNNPKLDMRLNNSIVNNGKQSLELEAQRHTACTGPNDIKVKENASYLLSFDYQSPNAQNAGYNVSFNGTSDVAINKQLPVKNESWKEYDYLIKVPPGADTLRLLVYAYSDSSGEKIINRYDNFSLIEIPAVENKFYAVDEPKQQLSVPSQISFRHTGASTREASVKGAKTPFFLTMSEAYHPQWRLELNNDKVAGLSKWFPGVQPDEVDDQQHFKLNDFMNAWYVDPSKLCADDLQACTKNSDGSYDLELVAEFTPQRWFNTGLVISGSTLAICLGYLGYFYIKKQKDINKPVWRLRK